MLSFLKHFINYKPNMSKDVESVLNLSVIYENDEEIPDDGRVYHFYKYGESIEDTAMKVKLQLAEYRKILECLCQHSAEHQSMRKRLSKITKRTIAEQTINKCLVCNVPINLDKTSDFVTCDTCKQSPICKNLHCAIWSDKSKVWNCKLCRSYLHGSSSACDWLISQLNERLLQGKDNEDHSKIVWSSNDDSAPLIPLEQREKVREFVEELVSTLVGGTIDNAPVGQLFENKEYLNLFSNYHSKLSKKLYNLELSIRHMLFGLPTGENETDTIDQSHTNLKHLVERIIEEVFKIPELFDHSGVPKEPQRISLPQFDPKKYEELLATAVLNKLVESYSYERRFENSSGIHSGSDIDGNVQSILQKAQLETLSTSSSNEPRSDSSNSVSLNDQPMSLTATDFIGNLSRENSVFSPIDSPPQTPRSVGSDEEAYLSDYIQKHKVPLPGIDAHDSDSFDEDYQSVNSKDTEGNWQENWLFKKRKLKNEMKSDIGMLVPSPMEDVKALIGDKTTDEVSDLSEAGSDIEDEENGPMNGRRSADLPHALVESKTIIGGKNDFAAFPNAKTIDELLQPDSLVSTQSAESVDVQSPVIMEAKNDLILMNDCDSRPIILHVKEKQRNGSKSIDDSLINERACVQNGSSQSGVNQSAKPTSKDASITKGSLFDAEGVDPPVPTPRKKSKSLESAKETIAVEGSIAEREHLKWMNAQVDIPNNPYSAEALQRRLSQTKSPSKVIDINLALAAKSIELDEDVTTKADNGKPLQIVLGAGEPDQLRYGRDYYINDSKAASGTRKKTSSIQRYSSTDEDNISSKPTTPDSDVFTARIVQIRDDPDQTSDDSTKLKLSITDRLSDNSSSLSLQSDSVQSDDSETRVYDLRKNETAYLRSDIIRTSRIPVGATTTPPPTPIDGESLHKNLDQFFAIQQLNQLKKSEEEQEATSQQKSQTFHSGRGVSKPLSPETLKFFTPKPKPVFTSKFKMEETAPIKPLILEREDAIPQNGTIEKGVIEEDVISSLPSVKALAKNFIEPSTETTKQPIQRPKTFAWQVSNEIGSNTNGHTKEPSPDSYLPNYETRYHPVAPGHSITARSLSTKFREELKHSISDDASNGSDNIEIVEREHSPDRPPSPVLLKGIFKEKMSFFQNLENK
ncbi:uncharacterized protein LOC119081716 isoform X6 [Bradysia coprophila]|uniref:uncharacterized protein LOC119081716 isoform X6 n=1 Tax=Bradysia coprophila TaxID=38358 RepID=UPI00187DCC6E|nr:uncharacterized protein LOC119081716 isoform X6 [Bradysia coprophila]